MLEGTGGGVVRTKNVRRGAPQQVTIDAALDWLLDDIDANCRKWLESGVDKNFNSYVEQARTLIGHGEITTTAGDAYVNAITSPADAPGFAIVISDDNAFFRGTTYFNGRQQSLTTNNGRIGGGTFAAQIFILLHEFGHSNHVSGFRNDANDLGAGIANNNDVDRECTRTIRDARRR